MEITILHKVPLETPKLVMEPSKLPNSFTRAIPSFVLRKGGDQSQLSSKDKRYVQQIEKVLTSFDTLDEWADYIAFLSRLLKALQLTEDPNMYHTVKDVYKRQVYSCFIQTF